MEDEFLKVLERYNNLPPIDRFEASQAIYNLIDAEVQRLLYLPRTNDVMLNLELWERVKRYIKENLR